MQAIIVEKPYVFVKPARTKIWSWLFQAIGLPDWILSRNEKVTSHALRGVEHLQASLAAGHGILLAPNHSRTADPVAMSWVASGAKCHVYGMASWHLFQSAIQAWVLKSMGAFSVNREGVDRAAVNLAIEILATAERPLVVFPEGATSRTNDRLGPLLDGVAFIARAGAKKRAKLQAGGKVVIHPVAIKYLYQGPVEPVIHETLTRIEQRLSWEPQEALPMIERIVKVGSALLALKEIEHLGQAQAGTLSERMDHLTNHLLHPHERTWLGGEQAGAVFVRVKALRTKLLPDMVEGRLNAAERAQRWKVLADLYLAQQIGAYPPDYLATRPSIDRMLEIVEKFEEDLTDVPRPHGPTKAIIEIGAAMEVSTERDRHAEVDPLIANLEQALQAMLDRLALESPVYAGDSK
jgi:1-acyl-sn-glycerol-3-phosphate acyltransferase